MAKFRIV